MNKEEVLFWIWLSKIKGVGPILSRNLLKVFQKPSNIYSAEKDELLRVQGIGKETARRIYEGKDLAYSESILENCVKKNIKILTIEDTFYPKEVKEISESPIVLYYRGNLIAKSIGIGIVGSRRCTSYGKRVAVETAQFLAQNNIPVISGMAKGIDSYSHTACLKENGYTIAVLGNGVDICYPKEHIDLMEKIIDNGAVISEYSPGTKPDALRFPKRNRIISAFSKRLLVVEASEKSGALITASYSKKYKREIYAVPNNIYSIQSKGTNELIYNGAMTRTLEGHEHFVNNSIKCILPAFKAGFFIRQIRV
ncbi:DNA-processing protein DprA [Clostridium sp. DL1XJH146]